MTAKYHTLFTHCSATGWCIEFGDYDYQTVLDEQDDVERNAEYMNDEPVTCRILTTRDDQTSIEDALRFLNSTSPMEGQAA